MTAHDHEVRYEEQEWGTVPRDGFARHATAEEVRVEGLCPRCQGPYVSAYRRGFAVVGSKGLFSRNRAEEPPPDPLSGAVHICACGHPHPGQPDALPFVGCGAQWRIETGTRTGEP
ncbi:hypothetical protein GCM10009801_76860 [Streptomyces albiaxialis]|uniref:Uncharacterized protein n=1 Tax=Streptomyces albiaxialis TaxID=329523 RepID=A0ABP5IP15_9ACTN